MNIDEWSPRERTSIMQFRYDDGSFYEQRVVDQRLDPTEQQSSSFSLYYFVTDLTYDTYAKPEDKPTILFIAGGPGQIVLPDNENFLDMNGYRTVYFHLRGTGFSQIPKNVDADKFLRTSYVVEDIEKIREDLEVADWTALAGHSYGAIVAQAYAAHPKYGRHVGKVVLSAPMAPVVSLRSADGKGEKQGFENLKKIYRRKEFSFLKRLGEDPIKLVEDARDISIKVQKRAGKVQYVADNYPDLEKRLASEGLDYGAAFYGAIRRLRQAGWLPLDIPIARPIRTAKVDDTQVQCGLVIANKLLRKKNKQLRFAKMIAGVRTEQLNDGEDQLRTPSTQNSDRAFWVYSIYDGLSVEFLRNLQSGKGTKSAITALGGETVYNTALTKVMASLTHSGLSEPKAWDPAEHKHNKATLILKGGADPVTENGEAEYYLKEALTGDKVLIEFPGIGHSMALPDFPIEKRDILKSPVRSEIPGPERMVLTRDALIHEFLTSKNVATFNARPVVSVLKETFETCFDDLIKSGGLNENERQQIKILP